jgi:hypothetical protein
MKSVLTSIMLCLCLSALAMDSTEMTNIVANLPPIDLSGGTEIINYSAMSNLVAGAFTSNYFDAITNGLSTYQNDNIWLSIDVGPDRNETYLSWDDHQLTFFPGTANIRMTTSNGVFKTTYDCPVDEAAKALLDAVEKVGESLGYVLITRIEYKRLKGEE